MDMFSNISLRKNLIFLVVNVVLCHQTANASEWRNDHVKYDDKSWTSGNSFNPGERVRYFPVKSENVWKPVIRTQYKKNFASQRPWGNVPGRLQKKMNNRKFYNRGLKQRLFSESRNYGQLAPSLYKPYGHYSPGYNSRLAPISIYPENYFLNTGLLARPMFW